MMRKAILKTEMLFEIIILITSIFSFSYFFREMNSANSILPSVSAQDGEDEPTDEQIAKLKSEIPELANKSNEEIRAQLLELERKGYLRSEDFGNSQAVRDALGKTFDDFEQNVDSGSVNLDLFSFIGRIIDLFGFIPQLPEIDPFTFLQNIFDQTDGLYVCPESKDGKICQIYTGQVIDDVCARDATEINIPQSRFGSQDFSQSLYENLPSGHECKLVTCYDKSEGVCYPRTPKGLCQNSDVEILEGDTSQCVKGCCIIAGEPGFITGAQCQKQADSLGITLGGDDNNFYPELNKEYLCLGKAEELKAAASYGACVVGATENDAGGCKFVKGEECTQLNGIFHKDILCSNQEVLGDTQCSKQNKTSCADGFDEVYWFDSCGNRENIFEGNSAEQRDSSWNDGSAKKEEESCLVGTNENPILNQANCGNCNRYKSSICGEEQDGQELIDTPDGNAVCRDMGCVDAGGKRREHGESWCAYQSKFGVVGAPSIPLLDSALGIKLPSIIGKFLGGSRAVDTPGSSHFRVECLNGDVLPPVACEVGRKEICVEKQTEISETNERTFSQATCRKNRWAECFAYNPSAGEGRAIGLAGPQAAWRILTAKLQLTCGLDSDCFVKTVDLTDGSDDTFKFAYCAPRYKPGFDLRKKETGEQICAQASQTCTTVFVHEISGWACKANCKCVEGSDPESAKPSREFVQTMNEFCTSLGDCGNSVNYVGAPPGGKGYSVTTGDSIFDRFSGILDMSNLFDIQSLLVSFSGDDEPIPGKYIDADEKPIGGAFGEDSQILEDSGVNDALGQVDSQFQQFTSGGGGQGRHGVPRYNGGYQGGIPDAALYAGGTGAAIGAVLVAGPHVALGTSAGGIAVVSSSAPGAVVAAASFANVLAGAAIGAAAVGFLIDILGLGPGLSPAIAYGLMGAGATGTAFVFAAQVIPSAAPLGPIGWIIIVVTLVILTFLKILGVGEVKEVPVTFECKPWVPPRSVDEESCRSCGNDKLSDGQDKFPCNKYSCEALGESCVFIANSEGPEGGVCEYSANDDTQAPQFSHVAGELVDDGFEISDEREGVAGGFTIRKKEGTGCLDQYESVTIPFTTNEWAKCYVSGIPRQSLAEMIPTLSVDGLTHTYVFNSLQLNSLGITNINQEERNDINLLAACEDIKGNNNLGKEIVISLCLIPEDHTPALINIPSLGIIPYGATEKDVFIYTNEPAECRWDFSDSLDINYYFEMKNELYCNNDLTERTFLGFECKGKIPISSDLTNVYFRCLDRPEWKGTDKESDRNVNQESTPLELVRSDTGLKVEITNPANGATLVSGRGGTAIEVTAATSGGLDGTAECFISVDESVESAFKTTGGTTHSQPLGDGDSRIGEGEHKIKARCIDDATNEAIAEIIFSVEIDDTIPSVTRIYYDDKTSELVIITDKESTCGFVNEKLEDSNSVCDFSADEGQIFNSDSTKRTHRSSFDFSKTYYIKCKDRFNNQPTQCSLIATGGY